MSTANSVAFPLGQPLYAGIPLIWEWRVRPHPATAKARDFEARIQWDLRSATRNLAGEKIAVVDSTFWLPPAPENVVVIGAHVYDTPGSKKIMVSMQPKLAKPYSFTWGSFAVNPNPAVSVAKAAWEKFLREWSQLSARLPRIDPVGSGQDFLNQQYSDFKRKNNIPF